MKTQIPTATLTPSPLPSAPETPQPTATLPPPPQPILYKQYVELCQPGGCEFLGFNIDPSFSNCVDALILVHINTIKEKKHQRYIESHAAVFQKRDSA